MEKLQEELESMQPLLAQAAQDTVDTMEQIKKDSVSVRCNAYNGYIYEQPVTFC